MESDSSHSSPILRVTTDISELKDSNEYVSDYKNIVSALISLLKITIKL